MSRIISTLAVLATLSAGAAFSQDSNMAPAQDQPAPIERTYSAVPGPSQMAPEGSYSGGGSYADEGAPTAQRRMAYPRLNNAVIAPGVWLRSTGTTVTQTLSATPDKVEVRVDHGIANLNVHHPDHRPQILVDLPGGQTAVLKDGLYTFNADTNTVRTLKGEAEAYAGSSANAKAVKVKEDHAVSFASADLKPYEFGPMDLGHDLLPGAGPEHPDAGYGYGGYGPYGDGFYGGYYGGPWAYGPYWGPGWGWGYPGFGLGFYGGGFYGGGFYGGGFGGFHHR